MASPRRSQLVPEQDTTTPRSVSMSPVTTATTNIDWKQRCEQLEIEHQIDLERVRIHYEHELKDKVTDIRMQLKREYDHQFAEFRARLLEQQQQQWQHLKETNFEHDHGYSEQIREQLRIAREQEHLEEDQYRQMLLQQSTDSDEVKRLVNKLHNEGIHVLSLSELLSLRLSGVDILSTDESIGSLQKLHEENSYLRSLIANMNANENSTALVRCLADIFRCEQERRALQIRAHPEYDQLEQEILGMCQYQRDALAKLLSQDRLTLINELDETREQLVFLQRRLEELKANKEDIPSHRLQKFYFKYLRCEGHRKALIYQKRYLLVLLTGYEDTEIYALSEIQRLTGADRTWNYPSNKMTALRPKQYHRRSFNYRFRFRCYVRVVMAVIRMRWLVRKWAHKLTTIR